MKKIALFIMTSLLISCSSNWQKYEISNAIEISISPKLELRKENSVFNNFMDDFRDEYNSKHTIKVNKSELIFQPKGTDALKETAVDDVTRVLISYFKIDSNTFLKWNFKVNKQELEELNEYFKKETIKDLKALPFESDIVEWNPFKIGAVNGLSYMKVSFVSIIDGEKTYTEMYQFFNTNEKVIISNTTNYLNKNKWIDTFDDVVKSFDFKLRK